MNKHLAIVCTLPTGMFLAGVFLFYLGIKYPIPDDNTIPKIGTTFMVGAIIITLQVLYSLYLG